MPSINEVSCILTYECNLSCSMCLQRYPYRGDFLKKFPSTMKLQDWVSVVNQLEPHRDTIQYIYLTGGEPFLLPYIFDLIRYIKTKHYLVSTNTNGFLLVDRVDEVLNSGLDFLILSVDGPEPVHNKIRNNRNSYANVVRAIREIRKKRKGIKPRIFVNCTIQEENYRELEGFVDELVSLGADQVFFHLQMFISQRLSVEYAQQYQELFQINPFAHRGAVAVPNIDTVELQGILKRIQIKYGKIIHTLHDISKIDLNTYFNYPEKTFRRPIMSSCYAAENILEIAPDGSVIPCHDFPDYIIGNVRQQFLQEIWTGDKMKIFLNQVANGNLFSICHRCCMSERYAGYADDSEKRKGAFRDALPR